MPIYIFGIHVSGAEKFMDDCFVYALKLLLLARRHAVKTISVATEEYI